MWSSVLNFIAVCLLLTSSAFFKVPINLRDLFEMDPGKTVNSSRTDSGKTAVQVPVTPGRPDTAIVQRSPVRKFENTFSINLDDDTLVKKIERKTHFRYTTRAPAFIIEITFDSANVHTKVSPFHFTESKPKVYVNGFPRIRLDTLIPNSGPFKDSGGVYEYADKNCRIVALAFLHNHPETLLPCLRR